MFTTRILSVAALLAPLALCAPAPTTSLHFGPGPVVFPVSYEEWSGYAPLGCTGAPTNNGSFFVGGCFDLAAPAHSIKLTPHYPSGTTCSVQFWDAAGCTAVGSEIVKIANQEQSGCIVPVFDGEFHSLNPPAAASVRVTCTVA
ncbi:hypothetical protein K488DRAFT_89486 [Vararia minispora EC-137]|uniref:Uncharacterized protein n=1 Tax=Vararia minispora EC-137 TaxID=1314806 RepID=A0ACB8QAW2_9AGAM|nr:hypothetical protein K488DRAFT_89486 [Vararia minispora EC-137]